MNASILQRGIALHTLSIPITIHTDKPLAPHPWTYDLYTIGSSIRHRDYIDCDTADPPTDGILSINHPLTDLDCAEIATEKLTWLLQELRVLTAESEIDEQTTNRERTARDASVRVIERALGARNNVHNSDEREERLSVRRQASKGFRMVRDNRFGFDLAVSIVTDRMTAPSTAGTPYLPAIAPVSSLSLPLMPSNAVTPVVCGGRSSSFLCPGNAPPWAGQSALSQLTRQESMNSISEIDAATAASRRGTPCLEEES